MLLRKGRKHRHTLKALTDPQPEFVSLVFGGANKTPFRALRADGATVGEDLMTEQSIKADTHAIARVEFSSVKFADENAVKAWLSNGGYDPEVTITRSIDGFTVDNTGELESGTNLNLIDMTDSSGLKVYTVAKGNDVLELTAKDMHPGATLLERTTELYENVRKSLAEGNGAVNDLVSEFMTQLDALIGALPEFGSDNYGSMIDAIAPEIEIEGISEAAQKMGARNNAKDRAMIQQMHDHALMLGAVCNQGTNSATAQPDPDPASIGINTDNKQKTAPKPYGDVKYADPKNGKYPINDEEHIRAAWSYIHMPKNHKGYTAGEVKAIKDRIAAAWKEHIDPAGPPEADKKKEKGMSDAKNSAGLPNGEDALPKGANPGDPQPQKVGDPALPNADRGPVGQQPPKDGNPDSAVPNSLTGNGNNPAEPGDRKYPDDDEIIGDDDDESLEADNGDKKKKEAVPSDVTALAALVTDLTNSIKSMQASLTEELGKVTERVAAVEETRQTRKGADVDEANVAGTAKTDVSESISDLRTKSMLGMRRR